MTEQMIKETETHKMRQNSNVAQRIIFSSRPDHFGFNILE